jgi:hypothetical protein
MNTSDFLQADDIHKVMNVPSAVQRGCVTDDTIEQFIGADSQGRQGRYYRLAAEKFGLVVNDGNYSSLTTMGIQFVPIDNTQKINFLRNQMLGMPVFSEAITYLQSTPADRTDLRKWFLTQYPGSPVTAERRFSTFQKYLRVTGFI